MCSYRQVVAPAWLAAVLTAGCAPTWRPPLEGVQSPAPKAVVHLADLGPGGPERLRTYRRFDPARPQDAAQRYLRRRTTAIRTEGAMAAKAVDNLADYLGPDAPKADQRWKLWPDDADHTGAAFFLEFDPPLIYLPDSIEAGRVSSQRVKLRYYNRNGICTRHGSVKRSFEFEGLETVEVDGVSYPDCARLKVETRLRIHWGPRVNITEYLWLAPGAGEVRRTERFSGFAFPIYFSEVNTYEALDLPAAPIDATDGCRLGGESWLRCAVYLDRLLLHPRLGGLAVELASESAALAGTALRHSSPE